MITDNLVMSDEKAASEEDLREIRKLLITGNINALKCERAETQERLIELDETIKMWEELIKNE